MALAQPLSEAVADRLSAVPVTTMASPGSVLIHQAWSMNSRPSATMAPHSGIGGWMPRPRKLKPETSRMLSTKSEAENTIDELITLGRPWRKITRPMGKPSTTAAVT